MIPSNDVLVCLTWLFTDQITAWIYRGMVASKRTLAIMRHTPVARDSTLLTHGSDYSNSEEEALAKAPVGVIVISPSRANTTVHNIV